MRYLLLLTLLFSLPALAQKNSCVKTKNISPAQRLKNYPFNQAASILAVSYVADSNSYGETGRKIDYRLPVQNDTICYSKLHETIVLGTAQVDSLTDILFNYTSKSNISISSACYRPRNALIFLNAKGESFAYIEICFECKNTRTSSDFFIPFLCIKQYELLKKLFIHSGISYGPETTIFNGI